MSELVCKIDNDCRDVSYIERTHDGRKNVYEVTRQSAHGNCHRNWARPIEELDARQKPGYRNKNQPPEPIFRNYDHVKPMSFLRKERPVRKITILTSLLVFTMIASGGLLIYSHNVVFGAIFGLSLFGFIINQLLTKDVAVESKALT